MTAKGLEGLLAGGCRHGKDFAFVGMQELVSHVLGPQFTWRFQHFKYSAILCPNHID